MDDPSDRDTQGATSSTREVVAAWVVVLVLLAVTVMSFALDHMVTVSDDPAAAIGAPSIETLDDPLDSTPGRELRDAE